MEKKIHLHDLRFMLSILAKENPSSLPEVKAKGKSVVESSSHSTSQTLGKRSRSHLEEENESNTAVNVRDYNSGVIAAYRKISEELPELRHQFHREGWFLAIKKLGFDADKVDCGQGPPFDCNPIFEPSDPDSDSDSAA